MKWILALLLIGGGLYGQIPELTIYEIQGQQDDSPYEGQDVTTYGIVTAVAPLAFFLEERPGGAWRGVYVYTNSTPTVNVGDSVRVTGEVQEYYGKLEPLLVELAQLYETMESDPPADGSPRTP